MDSDICFRSGTIKFVICIYLLTDRYLTQFLEWRKLEGLGKIVVAQQPFELLQNLIWIFRKFQVNQTMV